MTTLQVHCNLLYISLHPLHDLVLKIPNSFLCFLKDMYKQQRNFFSFCEFGYFVRNLVTWVGTYTISMKRKGIIFAFFSHVSPAIPGYLWSVMLYVG